MHQKINILFTLQLLQNWISNFKWSDIQFTRYNLSRSSYFRFYRLDTVRFKYHLTIIVINIRYHIKSLFIKKAIEPHFKFITNICDLQRMIKNKKEILPWSITCFNRSKWKEIMNNTALFSYLIFREI